MTNAISYLPEVDFIVVMCGGAIVQSGTYEKLLSENGDFADLIANYSLEENTSQEANEGDFVFLYFLHGHISV